MIVILKGTTGSGKTDVSCGTNSGTANFLPLCFTRSMQNQTFHREIL